MRARHLAWLPAAALAGCGTAPLSSIEGVPRTRTDHQLYELRVVSADGRIVFNAPHQPLRLDPGPRSLVLEAAPGRGAHASLQKHYVFKVEPCTRYTFAARRDSPMDVDWRVVVDHQEAVTSCDPAAELAKAAAAR